MDPTLRLGLELAPTPGDSAGAEGHQAAEGVAAAGAAARTAEEAGFGCVWVTGGAADDPPTIDALVVAGAVGAWTDAVSVGVVAALGGPARHPALLARGITALDVVSGGRAALLIEAGPDLEESGERWARLTEAAEVCRTLFSNQVSTYPGHHYAVVEAANRPPPLRLGGPLMAVALPELGSRPKGRLAVLGRLAESVDALVVRGPAEGAAEARRLLDRLGGLAGGGRPGLLWRGVMVDPGEAEELRRAGVDGLIVTMDRAGPPDQGAMSRAAGAAGPFGAL